MLTTFTYLLGFYLAGEIVARVLHISVPGNVLGMLFLFVFLVIRRRVPEVLDENVPKLLNPMVLFFMPSAVGVIALGPLLAHEGVGIVLTMVLSTVIPMVILGYGLNAWLRRKGGKGGDHVL